MAELEQLITLCERLGATSEQAATMAKQLLKRSEQLAAERGIQQVEALDYLLRLMISAREGGDAPEMPEVRGLKPIEPEEKNT